MGGSGALARAGSRFENPAGPRIFFNVLEISGIYLGIRKGRGQGGQQLKDGLKTGF